MQKVRGYGQTEINRLIQNYIQPPSCPFARQDLGALAQNVGNPGNVGMMGQALEDESGLVSSEAVFPPVVIAPSMGLSPVHRFRLTVGIHRSLYVLFRSTNGRNNIPGPFAETHPPPSR